MINYLNLTLDYIVEIGILIFEFIGVGIIIATCLISFYKYIAKKPDTKQ